MTPEGKVKAELKEYLDSLGADCWYYMPVPMGYGRRGIPDFIICYRSYFLSAETKKPGGKSEPWQAREQQAIIRAGGMSGRAVTAEQVYNWVKAIDDILGPA